ncbi:MAG: hypothetical protein ACT6FE_05450 [Methanosarcinaceae archaeon]
MWEVFNNREIATFVLLFAILPFLLSSKNIRKTSANLLKSMFSVKLIFPVILLAIYIGFVVYYLYRLELWTISFLKDTFFWFFSAGLLTIYKYITAKNNILPIKEILFDNLKLIVILEFLLNTYTFSFWAELIIIPVVSFTVMLKAFVDVKKKSRRCKIS